MTDMAYIDDCCQIRLHGTDEPFRTRAADDWDWGVGRRRPRALELIRSPETPLKKSHRVAIRGYDVISGFTCGDLLPSSSLLSSRLR